MRPRDEDLDDSDFGSDGVDPWGRAFVVERDLAGVPLDRFLASVFPDLDRNYLRSLVRDGRVRVDGTPMTAPRALWRNAVVTIDAGPEDDVQYQKAPPPPSTEICYEDEAIAFVNKPAGLILDQRNVAQHCPSLSAPKGDLLRVLEKLDRAASGLMIVTKNLPAHRAVEKLYQDGVAVVETLVVCEGGAPEDDFIVNEPIGSDERRTGKREVHGEGAEAAETRIVVKSRYEAFTVLVAIPKTHRTHQIRVHLQYAGLPIVGDATYGRPGEVWVRDLKRGYERKPGGTEKPVFSRMALHVQKIQLPSPAGVAAEALLPPPPDFDRFLKSLERYRSDAPSRRARHGRDS